MVSGFEWNDDKDRSNRHKHGVGFDEALSVFYDKNGLLIPDPDETRDEERFIIIGMSVKLRILVVCHCYRRADAAIRIISARKATRAERFNYEGMLP
jgi:uncharacterized DUF497 family protein